MGAVISLIPTDSIYVCILAPILILMFVVWTCKVFNFSFIPDHMQLPPPKKVNMIEILGQAARKYNKKGNAG